MEDFLILKGLFPPCYSASYRKLLTNPTGYQIFPHQHSFTFFIPSVFIFDDLKDSIPDKAFHAKKLQPLVHQVAQLATCPTGELSLEQSTCSTSFPFMYQSGKLQVTCHGRTTRREDTVNQSVEGKSANPNSLL